MELKKIKLTNFRNYENLELNFHKKNIIFIGNNAQGKTNILESIYYLGLTKSFFNINDKNLVNFDKKFLKIQGTIFKNNITQNLEIISNEKEKKVKIDNIDVLKFSNYISKLNIIVFNPDNIRLLKESPSYRRKYLNIQISQLYKNYIVLLNNFNKILKQRNEYLKNVSLTKKVDEVYLEILNKEFTKLSVDIAIYRNNYINKINEKISIIFKKLTNFDNLLVKYSSNVSIFSTKEEMIQKFYDKLVSNCKKDLFYGMTLIGPHRDDFEILLDNKSILIYGSQGQIRCSIIALKFSEVPIFKEILRDNPILLLDDIFSELDINKKNNLIEFVSNDIQTFITTTDLNNIDENILINSEVYNVCNGDVSFVKHEEGKVN